MIQSKTGELLGIDLVVDPWRCNLRCAYCLASEAPAGLGQERTTSTLGGLISLLDRCRQVVDCRVLRISGGEIFLHPEVIGLLRHAAAGFAQVQVLTNGTCLDEQTIAALAELPNLRLQISLDGHTAALNGLRISSSRQHERVLAALLELLAAGIPVELCPVLSSRNADGLLGFVRFLADRATAECRVYPFPVRGPAAASYGAGHAGLAAIEALLANEAELAAVLPPRAYLELVRELYRSGRRNLPCHLPRLMVQLFASGELVICPNCWTEPVADLGQEQAATAFARLEQARLRRLLLRSGGRAPFCTACVTPLDLLSLYLEQRIAEPELHRMGQLAAPAIVERLDQLGSQLITGRGRFLNSTQRRKGARTQGAIE